jgi:predicted polyphosphate/ATP-dependent NAD kinase
MRVGLIVNPIAGMGGSVALKGTDGAGAAERASALGAVPVAARRALRFLHQLTKAAMRPELMAVGGVMGGDAIGAAGLAATLLPLGIGATSSADDTRRAARAMRDAQANLIVFVGGDGTARDVLDAVGMTVPLLGVPSGVKMHSAVFATSPEAAARLVAALASGAMPVAFRDAEVMDIDEIGLAEGHLSARLHGYARVPFERRLVQAGKAGGFATTDALAGAAREIVAAMTPGTLYLIGPGTTAGLIKRALGFAGTLLGVDAACEGKLVGLDLTARQILRLAEGRPVRIIVGLVGGQGFVFGRGNQQLSPAVIRRAGRDGITIMAGTDKLIALAGAPLLLDTGDPALDRALAGFVRIVTGPGETAVMRMVAPADPAGS